MVSSDGRFAIAYNGEVYNYRAIVQELAAAGRVVSGGSDTAVLLEACACWGVKATLAKCVGMFAFALWDRETRTLTLARDRLGHQAALLGPVRRSRPVRFRAQGAARARRLVRGDRPGRAVGLFPACLRPGAAHHLQGHPKA